MMNVINPKCKILTVDTQSYRKWQQRFGGELPTEKDLWKEKITFMEMASDRIEFLSTMKRMASQAERVLIILDRFVVLIRLVFDCLEPHLSSLSSFVVFMKLKLYGMNYIFFVLPMSRIPLTALLKTLFLVPL